MPGNIPAEAMNVLSRTLAVGVVMLAPGFLGYLGDEYFGTTVLTAIGFIFGLIVGIAVLLAQAKLAEANRRERARETAREDRPGGV